MLNLNGESTAFDEFKSQLRGEVILPDSEHYETARKVWNGSVDRKPAMIVKCSGVADVIDTVNYARDQGIPLSVRGGGHSGLGFSVCEDGIVIDLSLMRTVSVDPVRKIAVVQGGARMGDVDRETQAFGLAAPIGTCATTGIGGAALGGGYGYLRRKYGLSIDNLVGANIVTANGDYLHVSESENKDVFWAIRGGGGNFGVVTSFEFKLYPVGPIVAGLRTLYDLNDSEQVFEGASRYLKTADPEVGFELAILTVPPAPIFPEALHFKQVIMIMGLYCGDVAMGQEALRPLQELATPLLDMSGPIPYRALQGSSEAMTPPGRKMYGESLYASKLNGELGLVIKAQYQTSKNPHNVTIVWATGGGKSAEVDPTTTAFGNREAEALVMVEAILDGQSEEDQIVNIEWTQAFLEALRPLSPNSRTYLNMIGESELSQKAIQNAYGSNYERLSAIKAKVDPDNLFRSNANIKPAVSSPLNA